jgi:RHH-type transcriptional regulator, proline utilization regulon repressor / proline dehydrogenase / delta 1-pyrroline-5-carboxylate dehydrogenase
MTSFFKHQFDNYDKDKFQNEDKIVNLMLNDNPITTQVRQKAFIEACEIVKIARSKPRPVGVLESFLEEFGLTTPEGLALMCLAEGLLRIPDQETADALIAEKITTGNWGDKLGTSESLLINASIFGLMLTGKVVDVNSEAKNDFGGYIHKLTRKAGEPVIRAAVNGAMKIMGEQFVLGRTINNAIKRGNNLAKNNISDNFSFDMLGEGARTDDDAKKYFASYANAINQLGKSTKPEDGPIKNSGISVKLSALHARYDFKQMQKIQKELYPRVLELAQMAAKYNIGFCIDAEESDRLNISLEILQNLCQEPSLKSWQGLGLAVQAYQKRVRHVIEFLGSLSKQSNMRLMVRLVKGAYWDAEIKRAQIMGREDFPVFTQKHTTDVSYIRSARDLLALSPNIYPQFATHNAHSLAMIINLAKNMNVTEFEFQRLHGMGDTLYHVVREKYQNINLRTYAPVGAHENLLPYLVRRLLENGANSSFVHAFLDDNIPIEQVVKDPFTTLEMGAKRNQKLALPIDIYGTKRKNSKGFDLSVRDTFNDFQDNLKNNIINSFSAHSIINGKEFVGNNTNKITSPSDFGINLGDTSYCNIENLQIAFDCAQNYQKQWNNLGGEKRAQIIEKIADGLEENALNLISILNLEAGKTFDDAIAEVREAVDFCRYYANCARNDFNGTKKLPSPAGETNEIGLMGRGVFVCISPWNFPLAIFIGQIMGALAAGNCVLAKPAEQTPLIAKMAVEISYAAGVPPQALHLLLGDGEIGAALTSNPEIAGVAFTGSTEVAKIINRTMAQNDGAIGVLIAETGGLNAMFVDTSALKEQVVDDVIISAFGSAGQRCSALRVLYLPNETADEIIDCLKGAMDELIIGNPQFIETDIGPVIDNDALLILQNHVAKHQDKIIKQLGIGEIKNQGNYFAPTIIEINDINELEREIFGPILHIIRYDAHKIETIGAKLASRKYGLTLGCHSRIDGFVEKVRQTIPAGNFYVNRTMIGAIVGMQPFGGLGLSGTGPKAGGPHYLHQFATEYVISTNIAAKGGDPSLFNL